MTSHVVILPRLQAPRPTFAAIREAKPHSVRHFQSDIAAIIDFHQVWSTEPDFLVTFIDMNGETRLVSQPLTPDVVRDRTGERHGC